MKKVMNNVAISLAPIGVMVFIAGACCQNVRVLGLGVLFMTASIIGCAIWE